MNEQVEALLVCFPQVASMDLRGRLMWLESISIALADARNDFGEAGDRAALDLRAALGAIIVYANSAQSKRDLLTMELTVRALLARAMALLYGALSDAYKTLAITGPHASECRTLSRVFKDVQRAVKRGDPIPPVTLRKLEALSAR
jgi:hypothetical protein